MKTVSSIFVNLAQTHSFYLVQRIVFLVWSYVLLWNASNYNSHPVLGASFCRESSVTCLRLSVYLLLLLVDGGTEINPGPGPEFLVWKKVFKHLFSLK